MTLHAIVDDEDYGQVATTQGWSDFIEWADEQGLFELAHLAYHGYATRLKTLAKEIDQAIAKSDPRPDIEATARGIQEIASENPKAKILVVSDGTSDGEQTDFDDDEEDEDDPDEDDIDEDE